MSHANEPSPGPPILTADARQGFIRDGFVRVGGLIPPEVVDRTRRALADGLGIDESDPATWAGKPTTIGDLSEPTVACKTAGIDRVAEELVGPGFSRDPRTYSPYREVQGLDPWIEGFIPVLRYPEPEPDPRPEPQGWHIDGIHRASFWPTFRYLVVFIYLVDVSERGGATFVLPGSHRQIFEHGYAAHRSSAPEALVSDAGLPDLPYQPARPVSGKAGDVLFMHYLLGHSGSANYDTHIRFGLNGEVAADAGNPYRRRDGAPASDWTPFDHTLRTDTLAGPGAA